MAGRLRTPASEWLGGIFPFPGRVNTANGAYQPDVIVWIAGSGGPIVGLDILEPTLSLSMAATSLVEAVRAPRAATPRPRSVRVASPALARALGARPPPGVEIVCAPTPELAEVEASLDEYLAANASPETSAEPRPPHDVDLLARMSALDDAPALEVPLARFHDVHGELLDAFDRSPERRTLLGTTGLAQVLAIAGEELGVTAAGLTPRDLDEVLFGFLPGIPAKARPRATEILHELRAFFAWLGRSLHARGADMLLQHLDARMERKLEARLGGKRARSRKSAESAPRAKVQKVFQLKVALRDIGPPIWRRLRVLGTTTLDELHVLLQAAFGWSDSHLHEFRAGQRSYGPLLEDLGDDPLDESTIRLQEIAGPGAKLRYLYDFGDGWDHVIAVERVDTTATDGVPRCLAGRRACPPEDCGGPPGYDELVAVLSAGSGESYDEMRGWVGPSWHPEAFDLGATNALLEQLAER
jgi:hypothetical protein